MPSTPITRKLMRLVRREHGSEVVEFALASMLLFSAIIATIEFGLAMYAYHYVSNAAQQGARYAMVRGAHWSSSCSTSAPPAFTQKYGCKANSTDVQNYVASNLGPGLSASNVTTATTWPGTTPDCSSACSACSSSTQNQGCMVKVQVSYTFNFLPLRFLPQSMALTSTAEKVIQE